MARENANRNTIGNVEFLEGDWTAPVVDRKFRVIVSNPPYVVAGDEALDALRAEPLSALAAGDDGLDAITVLATGLPCHHRGRWRTTTRAWRRAKENRSPNY